MRNAPSTRLMLAILGVGATCAAVAVVAPAAFASGEEISRSPSRETETSAVRASGTGIDNGTIVGVTDVGDAQKLEKVANYLAQAFKLPAGPIAGRLERLRTMPGNALYVQLEHLRGPARLVLTPTAGGRASLLVNGEMAVPVPETTDKSGNTVAVFWVERGREREYPLRIPASITHVTLVVNGREVVAAQPIRTGNKPLSFPVK